MPIVYPDQILAQAKQGWGKIGLGQALPPEAVGGERMNL